MPSRAEVRKGKERARGEEGKEEGRGLEGGSEPGGEGWRAVWQRPGGERREEEES